MRTPALVILAASCAVATACTSEPVTTRSSAATSGTVVTPTASTSTTASAAVTVTGAPAALETVIRRKYAGRTGIRATAAVGRWKGQQVAVVTAGQDVTLAATAPDWRIVGGWWPSLGQATPQVGGRAFVLALGSDARVEKGQPRDRSRADAIQLVGRDGQGGGGVLGIPRDSWVRLSGGGNAKINAAMVVGGPAGMTATVARVTGVPVRGYVVMSFRDVIGSVHALGGLPIVSDMTLGKARIRLGPQVLDGGQALWYARERKSLKDGDFGRSRHQGQLLLAAAVQGRLKGALWAPTVITVLDERTSSNLTATEVIQWVGSFYALSPAKVGRGVAAGSVGTAGGQSVVFLGARRGLSSPICGTATSGADASSHRRFFGRWNCPPKLQACNSVTGLKIVTEVI
jgi:LCP family protein required for cell wall assembly